METLGAFQLLWPAVAAGIAVSLLVSLGIVATKRWHGAFSMDFTSGVQKFHTVPTPRIGGVALMAGGLAAWLALPVNALGNQTAHLLALLILGATPAFVAGLVEDITKKVSVKTRLFATAASGLLAALLTGYWISYVNVPGLDWLLALAPLGIVFTAFAVAGIANSVNIIDGFNGLASGVVVLMLLTLAYIAFRAGDPVVMNLAFIGAAVVLGFMLVYGGTIIVLTLLLMLTDLSFDTAFSAVVASVNNMGPGLNEIGPAGNFQGLSDVQTWVCTLAMLLGRLEILSFMALLSPAFWRR